MEEKIIEEETIIEKSKLKNPIRTASMIVLVGVVLSLIFFYFFAAWRKDNGGLSFMYRDKSVFEFVFDPLSEFLRWYSQWLFIPIGCFVLLAVLFLFFVKRSEITVTNKRVYGKAAFGKQVDIPIDSITAVGTGLFSSIKVASSSGRIGFFQIENRDSIHSAISNLISQRQNGTKSVTTINQEIPQSNADELQKFKNLLDSGVITQEEFDAKKKDLLGL